MDAEKQAMQRRIDTLDRLANRLYAALTEYERENARLKAELETVKRERDAALLDMKVVPVCRICMHNAEKEVRRTEDREIPDVCVKCISSRKRQFAWRGLCKENGGIEA